MQIQSMINKRISDISCDSDHCYKAVPDYDPIHKKVVSMKI